GGSSKIARTVEGGVRLKSPIWFRLRRLRRCKINDQRTSRAAAQCGLDRAWDELVAGKQACRRTFLKARGGLIAGAATQVPSIAAAAQGAVAAENGTS